MAMHEWVGPIRAPSGSSGRSIPAQHLDKRKGSVISGNHSRRDCMAAFGQFAWALNVFKIIPTGPPALRIGNRHDPINSISVSLRTSRLSPLVGARPR